MTHPQQPTDPLDAASSRPHASLDDTPQDDAQSRPARVLVIDRTSARLPHIEACRLERQPVQAFFCGTVQDARACAADGAIDLLVVHTALPDGDGIDLAHELTRHRPHLHSVVIAHNATVPEAKRAIRLGAVDYLTDSNDHVALQRAVRRGLEKTLKSRRQASRLDRLRRLCDKLDQANKDVSKQVDRLCRDLVTAYQDLAGQMNNVVQTTEYASLVRDELDLENVIRRTLEHLVAKAGATNCAVFLPATADEYAVGGYVNYDVDGDAGELVLAHLADVLAPWIGELGKLENLPDDAALDNALGEDADMLLGRCVLAFPCVQDGEPLAVVALFRDAREPFESGVIEVCQTVAPLLAESLTKVIKIHHRALPDEEPDGEDDGNLPF